MSKKIALTLLAVLVLMLSACTRAASTPLPTPTTEANFPAVPPTTSMNVVEQAGTQTAIAQTGTPQAGAGQPATATPAVVAIATFTPMGGAAAGTPVVVTPTPDGAVAGAATALPSLTPVAAQVGKPASYTIKEGEFPYCIARRYNVDPDELLALNGLSKSQSYYTPGTVLKIPTSGKAFPAGRAIIAHPVAYVVKSGDTIYSIACKFGDVDPLTIASTNNLAAPYNLTTGTQINIP
jgi:LysM repeat protein